MDASTTDEALMLAYRDGSYPAFEALYSRHKGAVLRFYTRQAGTERSEELLQEAFTRLVVSRSRYRPTALFKTYLWTLVRSALIDHYRKQGRSLPPSYSTEEPEEVADSERVDPARLADQDQRLQHLMALIATLPAAQRESFLLKEEAGLSVMEISKVVGESVDTIKSRLRYAVTKLRAGMEAV